MKKYLYLIKNAKIPTYLKYWLMYSSKKISLLIQSLPITLENTIKDLKLIINKIYGNTIQDGEPTPENPVPIENITGDVEINVQNKNVAKETFDQRLNATGSGNNKTVVATTSYNGQIIKVKPNTSYYAIGDFSKFGDSVLRLVMFNEYPVVGSISTKFNYGSSNGFTFTTEQNTHYILLWNTFNRNTTAPNIFICETQYASTYVLHQEQNYLISLGDIELCKIGTAQDYIYKQNGNWYKYGAVGKVVLNGSENWNLQNVTSGKNYYTRINLALGDSQVPIYSNLSKYRYFESITENVPNYSSFISQSKNFNYLANIFDDVNALKTFLATTNLILYYLLATPVITQITDTTLINQLNALEEAYTYEDVTNISSNQNIYLDIDYVKRG